MAKNGKKRKMEIQKFEYLKNKKCFLDKTNSIFCNNLRATTW